MRSVIEKLVALAFFAGALLVLVDFPVARIPLIAGTLAYAGVIAWRPGAWLVLLPALLPLLYLSPWSGRLYLDEFDVLCAATFAVALWQRNYAWSFRSMQPGARIALAAFVVVYLIALGRGLLPLPSLNANAVATYYSELNSLRVAKGLFWAFLLYSVWVAERRRDLERARSHLTTGMALGALAVFLLVLWERQVFQTVLFWTNKYAPIQALLDFSTEYRVTALFADMHTGGTAIDGFLLLAFPFAALAFFTARTPLRLLLGGTAFLGVLYAGVMTFSRGVYLGLAAAILATVAMLAHRHWDRIRLRGAAAIAGGFSVLLVLGGVAFVAGGVEPLAYVVASFLTGATAARFRHSRARMAAGAALAAAIPLVVLSALVIAGKDYALQGVPAPLLAVVLVGPSLAAGALLSIQLDRILSLRQVVVTFAATSVLCALMIPSLLGYRMVERFSEVSADLQHRLDHWQTAIAIMDDDWTTTLLGEGLGSFPRTYFWRHQMAKDVGGFTFQEERGNQFLRFLGAHDVRLGQRVRLRPHTRYTLGIDVRTEDPAAALYMRACHRHLIHPFEWNPTCVQIERTVESTHGDWKRLTFEFDSEKLGTWKHHLQAPLVFSIANRRAYAFNLRPQTILDMDNLSLRGPEGTERIANGDFAAGIDRWFAYYDFNHLPWHIKNLWVHVYFETGAAGLLLFVLLLLGALKAAARAAAGEPVAFAIGIGLVGFLAVGSFGTLVDAPRIGFLFYFLTLVALGFGRGRRRPAGAPAAENKPARHGNDGLAAARHAPSTTGRGRATP